MTQKIAMIATFALLGILPALGQDARGRVRGTVTDGSGASIAKATVILTNSETKISAKQETTPSGQYIFDFVLPGTYTVQVELSGFKKFLQKNLLVQTRADVTMNATLKIGSVREQITVEAAPVAVQFTTSTMGLTVDTKMTNNLPIIHRNPFLLAALNPAVVVRSGERSIFLG